MKTTVKPPRAFALLEDVDAAFVRRDAADMSQSRSYVTFSGLLNALDGVSASVIFRTVTGLMDGWMDGWMDGSDLPVESHYGTQNESFRVPWT
jgi:hypothetical protein